MPVTTTDGLMEMWADGIEAMEQNLEAIYGPPGITPTLPDVTTEEGMLEAIAEEAENAVWNVGKDNNVYYDVAGDSYSNTLPAGLLRHNIKKIGGKTIIWNQWVNSLTRPANAQYAETHIVNNNNGSFTFAKETGGTVVTNWYLCGNMITGHKFLVKGWNNPYKIQVFPSGSPVISKDGIYTISANNFLRLRTADATWVDGDTFTIKPFVRDLTQIFGAGNEPSTLEDYEAIIPNDQYDEYSTGKLVSMGVTEVVSKDGNGNIIDMLPIPEEVQSLEGYGWAIPNYSNYIDMDAKKYVQAVGSRPYEAGDESDTTVITDGTTTYYKLDTDVETDISEYLINTNLVVEPGGSVVFKNQHGYHIAVYNETEYVAL